MQTFTHRLAISFALSVSLGLGCAKKAEPHASPDAGPTLTKATLALDWVPEPEFGGFYAARESGAYTKHGIGVEIQGGGPGAPISAPSARTS